MTRSRHPSRSHAIPGALAVVFVLLLGAQGARVIAGGAPAGGEQAANVNSADTTPHAGQPTTVLLEELTWTQVRDRMKAGTKTVIIPTGGTEQNGPHMVLGKHNFIIKETARRIARRLGNTLVAPVLAYVPEGNPANATGHMAFPGTISMTSKTFERVLEQAATSFKTHGFSTIIFLGDSGGNQAPQARVATRLNEEWHGSGVHVIHARDYYAKNGGEALLAAEGETAAAIGTHAGIRDTSELMAVFPKGVDLKNAVVDKDGVIGDPRRATKARGERLLEAKVKVAVDQITREKQVFREAQSAGDAKSPGFISWLKGLFY